jgi:hypothetical protein
MAEIRDRIKGLKHIPVAKLRGFSGGNPKKYTESDRTQLEGSMTTHGYVSPMVVREVGDGSYEMIDGHHRLEVYVGSDPDAKVKCIVIDVDSVAEGRRILLALKRTADWDMDALEKFARESMAEGISAAEIMADTGFTGADLDALASAGAEFLNGIETPDDDGDNGRVSRKGLVTEHVQFATPLARDQSPDVYSAIKLAKQLHEVKVTGDALVAICRFYLEHHKTKEK